MRVWNHTSARNSCSFTDEVLAHCHSKAAFSLSAGDSPRPSDGRGIKGEGAGEGRGEVVPNHCHREACKHISHSHRNTVADPVAAGASRITFARFFERSGIVDPYSSVTMKDKIPVDPAAELSLDNVLTDIRFRGRLGFKLKDYTFSSDFNFVELEFEKCGGPEKSKKP